MVVTVTEITIPRLVYLAFYPPTGPKSRLGVSGLVPVLYRCRGMRKYPNRDSQGYLVGRSSTVYRGRQGETGDRRLHEMQSFRDLPVCKGRSR